MYNIYVRLNKVVLNNRDKHKKTWSPDFTHLNNMPNNIATSPSNKLEDRLFTASNKLIWPIQRF